ETKAHRDLSRAAATQLGTARAGDASESGTGNGHIRISQVHVIGYVGERGAGFEFDSLGQVEGFVQTEREIDCPRASDDADARSAETADGRGVASRIDADSALIRNPRSQPRADEGIHIEPLISGLIRDVAIADPIRVLVAGQTGTAA